MRLEHRAGIARFEKFGDVVDSFRRRDCIEQGLAEKMPTPLRRLHEALVCERANRYMAYLIGTDEAGYGPNFGPLVITACLWEVDGTIDHVGLYHRLDRVVARQRPAANDPRIWIGDSKLLFRNGSGLSHLERAILAILFNGCDTTTTWRSILGRLASDDLAMIAQVPWFADFDHSLPIDVSRDDLESAAALWRGMLPRCGVRLLRVVSRVIVARHFNDMIQSYGNKSNLLSMATVGLVRDLASAVDNQPIFALCDKHGGRNRYGQLLQEAFGDTFVETWGESRSRSVYRFGPSERRIECCFQAKADGVLAAALASMVSKYLREIAMLAFNQFWCDRQDGLRPTAGYPVDAKRFKQEIQASQQRLEISDHDLWRSR